MKTNCLPVGLPPLALHADSSFSRDGWVRCWLRATCARAQLRPRWHWSGEMLVRPHPKDVGRDFWGRCFGYSPSWSRAAPVRHLYSSSHTEPSNLQLWPSDPIHLHQLLNTCCHYYHWHATSMIFNTICCCRCCFLPACQTCCWSYLHDHKSLYYPVIVYFLLSDLVLFFPTLTPPPSFSPRRSRFQPFLRMPRRLQCCGQDLRSLCYRTVLHWAVLQFWKTMQSVWSQDSPNPILIFHISPIWTKKTRSPIWTVNQSILHVWRLCIFGFFCKL